MTKKRRRAGGAGCAIQLTKGCKGREYDDIIDAAYAAVERFGSAPNALATFVRESPTFRQISGELVAKAAHEENGAEMIRRRIENSKMEEQQHGAKKTPRVGGPRRIR